MKKKKSRQNGAEMSYCGQKQVDKVIDYMPFRWLYC